MKILFINTRHNKSFEFAVSDKWITMSEVKMINNHLCDGKGCDCGPGIKASGCKPSVKLIPIQGRVGCLYGYKVEHE